MHSLTLNRLKQAEKDAKKEHNPWLYLERLGPLHFAWHDTSFVGRQVGFLLFHWHVIQHFKALDLDEEMNVDPYGIADFTGAGSFAEADWNASMGGLAPSSSFDDLVTFSQQIEAWHGDAHMIIGEFTGAPMMDPEVNIFYAPFWNLHFFINQKFEDELKNYAASAHPPLEKIDVIIKHIEKQHHGVVSRI